ncbi:MAG: CHAD domain-containing protein [Isosphaeraceae bacterium]
MARATAVEHAKDARGAKTCAASGRNGHPTRQVRPGDPVSGAVLAAFEEGAYWLGVNLPRARDGDPEGVHHLRTTSRRLRTALDLCDGLADPDWAESLSGELKWLAGLLGAVRDLDVIAARFRASAEEVGEGLPETIAPLFWQFDRRHAEAASELGEALRGPRFGRLEASLIAAASSVPFLDDAREPCREALPRLVLGMWKKLRDEGRDLGPDSPPEAFHGVRKRAKHARYAAEAAAPALDPDSAEAAERFARRARAVQDVLGAHQDASVASLELRKAAAAYPTLGDFNFAVGRLVEREERAAAAGRERFFEVWPRLDRRKLLRWLKP